MLIQSFEAPRKLPHDLGAGVAAGALFLGQGLVALITTRPGRLLVQPEGGAEGVAVSVSIEAAQEIALLSKDVAVVLSADHVLWALSDLHEEVKIKQIAREVRALAARPFGENALAIGVDGKARALTLNRSAVSLRTFGLRGTLRACDIGEQVTYAVVDLKTGGQLRIHPGPTPELGTSARVALPEGAAELDRVRGGQALTVLYKRGEATVCLVRGPGKLEAKLVQLEAKPVDVAVLDGHLLVAFADGRLALYDSEALARAGDAPLAATSSIPLGAKGKPRVILAATGKAGPALWVGTSAGEVLCARLRKEAAEAAPRPRAEATARPKEAVEASAPARSNEAPAAAAPASAPAPAARERELEAALASLQKENEAALASLQKDHEAALASARKDHEAALASAQKDHEATLGAALKEHEAARTSAQDQAQAERKALQGKLAGAEEQARARKAELEARAAELDVLQGDYDALAGRLGMIEEQTRGWSAELEARAAERDGFLVELEALQGRLGAAEEVGRGREAELAARTAERDRMTAAIDALQRERSTAQEQAGALQAELTTRTAERDGLKTDLDTLQRELSAAQEQASARQAELTTRTAERDGLKTELERSRTELERSRTELERLRKADASRLINGFGSIGRARERLDSVVSQVQSVLFRRPRD